MYYETESGTRGQSNMRRVGRIKDGFQAFILDGAPLSSLSESVTLDIRGLDDRLDNFHVEAVPPPVLTDVTLEVRYPDYLRSPYSKGADMSTSYQSGVRLREGSDVTLIATSSVPLGDAEVLLKTDEKEPSEIELEYSSDRQQVQFTIPNFNAATTVNVVPRDIDGISAQAPYRYFLGVVLDELPELEVALKGIGSSITPKAKLPITVNATDDYGITDVTLSVTPANQNSEDPPSTNENDETTSATTSPEIDRNGAGSAELDLKNLTDGGRLSEILPGNAINLIGEATDGYNLGDNHITRSEVFRLEVVTAEQLLALLERRELGLRSRLEQTIEEADFSFPVTFNGQQHIVNVRRRPYLVEFMEFAARHFEVVVFTASQRVYAERLLNKIDPNQVLIKHRLYRESCVLVEGNYMKDLSVLGRDLAKTIIVDNSPQAFGFQVDNGVPIESWFDDQSDRQLLKLMPLLARLAQAQDVRPVLRKKFALEERIERAGERTSVLNSMGSPRR